LPAPHLPTGPTMGVAGNGGYNGVVKPDTMPTLHPLGSLNTNSHVPTTLNRGVNGTSVARHGLVQAGIGGPAKTSAGLSGTTIRPVH
jgi:hypothetical protein